MPAPWHSGYAHALRYLWLEIHMGSSPIESQIAKYLYNCCVGTSGNPWATTKVAAALTTKSAPYACALVEPVWDDRPVRGCHHWRLTTRAPSGGKASAIRAVAAPVAELVGNHCVRVDTNVTRRWRSLDLSVALRPGTTETKLPLPDR